MTDIREKRTQDARRHPTFFAGSVAAWCLLCSAAGAQDAPGQNDAPQPPTAASLTVGAMSIAADAALNVDDMAIDVSVDHVIYKYKFANKGSKALSLDASVALPDLEINDSENVFYDLPTTNAENIVGLQVESGGKPIPTTPYVQALSLGIDHLAELKADNIPLIPFGDDTGKALSAAKPDMLAKLESHGLIAPHDDSQQGAAIEADWSLHVVHGWVQTLEPSSTTAVNVAFAPVKAVYTIDATSLSGLDSLSDQVCVTPQVRDAAAAMLKDKGATASVADISLATDGPARFLQDPRATIAVHKPSPKAIVVFCGMDPASQGSDLVKGAMPENADTSILRVLIFDKDR